MKVQSPELVRRGMIQLLAATLASAAVAQAREAGNSWSEAL